MIAQLRPVKRMKSAWIHYEPEQGDEFLRLTSKDPGAVAANNTWRLKEYSLVNLDSGKITALIDAPQSYSLGYSSQSQATWSPDERSVLLINTFLSLDRVGEADQFRRLRPCAIADVRLPSMDSHCVVFMSDLAAQGAKIVTESLSFGRDDDEVTFAVRLNQGGEELQRYSWTKSGWQRGTIYASTQEGNQAEERRGPNSNELTVTVKQGLNDPPTLWVTNVRTGQSKMLWDPNPQLVHLQFGKASVYHWKDRSGHEWTGGLVMPAGYVVGKRYPLVLQIYNFDESQFLTDGMMPTAFAARALASSGVAVLQIQRRLPHTFDMAEADAQLAGLESAIDQLSAEGIAAPQRVGLVGFSFSCWYVENALIKAPTRFMAATIADGLDVSYMQYHLWGIDSRSLEREFDAVIGSKPFGKGLSQWLEQAPGFHLDLVQTPLRIEAIGPMSILGEWEIYSSLKMQGKPVDLIYFPTGQHIHQNPLERLESQEGDVDWFRFWLQGYADPAPSKRDQYERWEKLRDGITSSKTITGQ
jgi:hypothetical protein